MGTSEKKAGINTVQQYTCPHMASFLFTVSSRAYSVIYKCWLAQCGPLLCRAVTAGRWHRPPVNGLLSVDTAVQMFKPDTRQNTPDPGVGFSIVMPTSMTPHTADNFKSNGPIGCCLQHNVCQLSAHVRMCNAHCTKPKTQYAGTGSRNAYVNA